MDNLINHHIHSIGSDGSKRPREIVEGAIKKKLSYICFTDHNIRDYIAGGSDWQKDFWSESYLKEIKTLKEKYKGKIEIGFGIEIDWAEGSEKIIKKQIKQHKFDYVLGSVHLLKSPSGDFFGINFESKILEEKIKKLGIKWIINEYYSQIRLLAKSKFCNCIGHLDVIKTLNKNNKYFKEDDFYKKEVIKTLDEIKKQKVCIEVNTSGLTYPCKSLFPSQWIIKEAKERNIPVTVGTDYHGETYGKDNISIDYNILETYKLLKKVGYNSIVKFKNKKPVKVKL